MVPSIVKVKSTAYWKRKMNVIYETQNARA